MTPEDDSNAPEPSASELADAIQANGIPALKTSLHDILLRLKDPGLYWKLSAETLRLLCARHGSSAILAGIIPWKSPQEFWSFRPIFDLLVPSGPFSPPEILALFDATPRAAFADMAIGTYAATYVAWARQHPADAEGLFTTIVAAPEPDRSFLLLPLAEGIVTAVAMKEDEEPRLRRLLASIESSENERPFRVYLALTPLLVEHRFIPEHEALDLLRQTISLSRSEAVVSTATVTVRFLWKHVATRGSLHALLRQAAEDERPIVRVSLAEVLFHPVADSEDSESRALLEELLPGFASVAEEHHAIIDKVAWTLFSVAKKDPKTVLRFLRGWVIHRPSAALYLWDSKRFLHVLSELPYAELVSEMIRWLLADAPLQEAAVATLTRELSLSVWPAGTALSLSDVELKSLALVLSIRDDNEHAVDLLFSLVTQIDSDRELDGFWEIIEQCLAHAIANYRGRANTRIAALQAASHPKLRLMHERLGGFDANLTSVQKLAVSLRELAPPSERSRLWHRIESTRHAELMRSAEQADPGRTPLYHLIPKVQILAPGSYFFAREGQLSGPTRMQKHSLSFELPRLHVIDPRTEVHRRAYLLKTLRGLRSPTP